MFEVVDRSGVFSRNLKYLGADRYARLRSEAFAADYGSGPTRKIAYKDALERLGERFRGMDLIIIRKRRREKRGDLHICELEADLYRTV